MIVHLCECEAQILPMACVRSLTVVADLQVALELLFLDEGVSAEFILLFCLQP